MGASHCISTVDTYILKRLAPPDMDQHPNGKDSRNLVNKFNIVSSLLSNNYTTHT